MNLLNMAQSGRLRSQVTEGQLVSMIEQMEKKKAETSKVTFQRRRVQGWSSDEDDDNDDDLR